MFLDREMTPELKRELIEQQFVIAGSKRDAVVIGQAIKTEIAIPAMHAASELDRILEALKGSGTPWTELKGLRVLDLASGSADSRDLYGTWYPHFSRLCAVNGADVIAIDARPQRGLDESMFSWTQANLIDAVVNGGLKSVPILKDRQFDIIHSANFVGFNPIPGLHDSLAEYGIGISEFGDQLKQQSGELLVDGGVLSLGDRDERMTPVLYTKADVGLAQFIAN